MPDMLADPGWQTLTELLARLGAVGIPLAICAVAVAVLIPERLIVLLRPDGVSEAAVAGAADCARRQNRAALRVHAEAMRGALRTGALVLIDAEPGDKDHREEAASLWLDARRAALTRRLGLLQLIAAIAPMLGLLGTVIGMVVAFQAIAAEDGPVGPALLADGLWQAMLTTIAGLAIALPAIVARWVFAALAEARIASLAGALSRLSLAMEAYARGGGDAAVAPVRDRAA